VKVVGDYDVNGGCPGGHWGGFRKLGVWELALFPQYEFAPGNGVPGHFWQVKVG